MKSLVQVGGLDRRRFQYSLRALLIFVTLCAVFCSWFAPKIQKAKREREAVAQIEKLGGAVRWDWYDPMTGWDHEPNGTRRQPQGPAWLRALLGENFFASVDRLEVTPSFGDEALEHVRALRSCSDLDLSRSRITDYGLKHIEGLSGVLDLYLGGTKITDAGLKHLQGFSDLQTLALGGTRVTDAGLAYLRGMSKLEYLDLRETEITDVGLGEISSLGLRRLETLHCEGTRVTREGVDRLRQNSAIRYITGPGLRD